MSKRSGLVKFDFLGLATLTILELAKDFIVARRPATAAFDYSTFDYDRLPLDDPRVSTSSSPKAAPSRCSSSRAPACSAC